MNPSKMYLVLFILSIVFSIIINKLFLKFSSNLGMRSKDNEDMVRWASTSKPAFGGISFFITFLIGFALIPFFFESYSVTKIDFGFSTLLMVILAFIMGLADDAYNTKPWLKFGVQLLCGLVLIAFDHVIYLTPFDTLNYLFTILWVVGIMNSINMLDNMDGITSITSLGVILPIILLVFLGDMTNNAFLFLLLSVAGGIVGFFSVNWHPSKMYMGDSGSQFLGAFLSVASIKYLWNGMSSEFVSYAFSMQNLVEVLLIFLIPITDTTLVTVNRLRRGQSPFVGGRDHSTHHLSYLGLRDNQIGICFIAIILLNITIFFLIRIYNFQGGHLFMLLYSLCYMIFIFGLRERNRKKLGVE